MSIFSKALGLVKSAFKLNLSAVGFALAGPLGASIAGSLLGGGGGGGGGILGEIMRYGKMVQDLVESPIKHGLEQVKAGAWEGEDADAFVDDMQRNMLPKVADLIGAIFGISTNISTAVTNVLDAEKKSLAGGVSQALDSFNF